MNITRSVNGEAAVFRLRGRLDSTTSPLLQSTVLPAIQDGPARLALDFSGVEYVSSAGLRVLLMAAKQARAAGGGAALFGLSEPVREVFEISGLTGVIPISADEAAAVRALEG